MNKTFLYFLEAENGLIKVGITDNLNRRIYDLAKSNAVRIKLMGYIEVESKEALIKEREMVEAMQ